ncbi:signal peptidase I [Gordonia sp. X0973]|uniref:signal peptidase I n=1 Tax=Gordonia sp. X0973 TaxID=2742602 RepID=UPI000F526B5D|nr:signal peptidase I [Gordonia sp. X0973]QKT07033.1 signal peptidase I [Gordonia sp. X0973]
MSDDNDENIENGAGRRPWSSKADQPKGEKSSSFLRELAIIVGVVLLVSWVGQTFLFRQYVVPSQSMESTLIGGPAADGKPRTNDRIVIDKLSYRFGEPQPGDVVVFKAPTDSWNPDGPPRDGSTLRGKFVNLLSWFGYAPPNEYSLVKRVIATGGQTVECHNADGGFKVDGKLIHEPYINQAIQPPGHEPCYDREFDAITVPKGNVWVMGDNRSMSADSRYHTEDKYHGTVPLSDVRGKVRFIMWPFSRMGGVGAVNPQK